MEVKIVSASDLNLFNTCPLWYFMNKQRLPGIEVDKEKAQYGTDVHNLINEYYKCVKKSFETDLTPDIIESAFNDLWGKSYINDSPAFRLKSSNVKETFIKFERERLEQDGIEKYHPSHTEYKVTCDNLVGIIDFYNEATGTIIDWKTGSMVTLNQDNYIQGKIYERMMTRLGKPVNKVLFVALASGMTFELPQISDGWLDDKISYLIDNAKLDNFKPKPSGLCPYCPYILRCQSKGLCLWL